MDALMFDEIVPLDTNDVIVQTYVGHEVLRMRLSRTHVLDPEFVRARREAYAHLARERVAWITRWRNEVAGPDEWWRTAE